MTRASKDLTAKLAEIAETEAKLAAARAARAALLAEADRDAAAIAALEAAMETASAAEPEPEPEPAPEPPPASAAPELARPRHMPSTVKPGALSHGTVGASPVASDVGADGLSSTLFVTLSADYARNVPPGYPNPDPGVAAATSQTATAMTIPKGARVRLFKHEALALVAAGGGVLS